MNYEIVSGKRRTSHLIYTIDDKFLYTKKDVYKTKITYRCYNKTCNAKIFLENNICNKTLNCVHDHENHDQTF